MRVAFPDTQVEGYEALEPTMTCDPKDRHVLAAAVRSNAALLVTFNLKNFPLDSLTPYNIEVAHPNTSNDWALPWRIASAQKPSALHHVYSQASN